MSKQQLDGDREVSPSPGSDLSFGDILLEYEQSQNVAPEGEETRQGTVVAISPDFVFVDIGLKMEGTIAASELRDAEGTISIKRGDKLPVAITGRSAEGYYQLSKVKIERPKNWGALQKAFEEKRTIGGVVTGAVKGGFSVDIGVRAFMPASRSGSEMEKLIGQEIACKIIKLDVAAEDVVVDRRLVLEEDEARAKERRFAELQEGAVVEGTVRSLTDYGAFIDLGGIDGLLHVTDLSWGRVNKASDVLSLGDRVEVQILKIDRAKRRISLGIKQLKPDPWTLAGGKYKVGDRVRGAVSRLTDFGAFVELEPGLEGLIHLSDMSWSKKVRKPADVVKPGDSVDVVVLGVHPAERRISLGLKQALGDPWEEAEKRFPLGSIVEAPVTNLQKFGAFLDLGDGIEGMIHIGDLSSDKRLNHPREVLKPGQPVRAAVLEVDPARRRIRLGLKQLEPTTMDEYIAEHKEGDVVTGRIAGISNRKADVELGEGIQASCHLGQEPSQTGESKPAESNIDLTALSSMLSAKWKQGKIVGSLGGRKEPARAGQVRNFRIVRLDRAEKKIELELAG